MTTVMSFYYLYKYLCVMKLSDTPSMIWMAPATAGLLLTVKWFPSSGIMTVWKVPSSSLWKTAHPSLWASALPIAQSSAPALLKLLNYKNNPPAVWQGDFFFSY